MDAQTHRRGWKPDDAELLRRLYDQTEKLQNAASLGHPLSIFKRLRHAGPPLFYLSQSLAFQALDIRIVVEYDSLAVTSIRVTIQVGAPNWHNHQVVTVQECSILAHLGL
jgi:hypothetical protein